MILIEVLGISWEPGKKLKLKKYSDFERWLCNKFVKETVKAIETQSLSAKWPPLNRNYKNMKIRKGLSPNMWEATEELKKSLKVKTGGRRLIIGYDNRYIHGKSKIKCLDLARILEFGSVVKNIPPRPLFRQIYRVMDANLGKFYKLYLKEVMKK